VWSLTPHPRAHALYADKRNLMLLSDEAALQAKWVSPEATRKILARRHSAHGGGQGRGGRAFLV
jgi:hypothetical protein